MGYDGVWRRSGGGLEGVWRGSTSRESGPECGSARGEITHLWGVRGSVLFFRHSHTTHMRAKCALADM
jgi:hypothetical protein